MQLRICDAKSCSDRRIHHERPNEARGPQMVEVSDELPVDKKVYCSITCALLSGAMTLAYEPKIADEG